MKINDRSFVGVLAALAISLTAAIALPLVNIFVTLEPSELMVVRGGCSALLVAVIVRRRVEKRREHNKQTSEQDRLPLEPLYTPTKWIIEFSVLFSMATLAFYSAIRAWGASPTLVVLTLTPVVNIVAKMWRGQKVDARVHLCLVGMIIGVTIALDPRQDGFSPWGLFLSLLAGFLAGCGFEVLGGRKGVDPYNKSLWLSVVTMIVGFLVTVGNGYLPLIDEAWTLPHVLALAGFGIVGGFAYYLANIVAVERLKTEVASTLAMLETPAVVASASVILGEHLTPLQWGGVLIAFLAASALGVIEARQNSS